MVRVVVVVGRVVVVGLVVVVVVRRTVVVVVGRDVVVVVELVGGTGVPVGTTTSATTGAVDVEAVAPPRWGASPKGKTAPFCAASQ